MQIREAAEGIGRLEVIAACVWRPVMLLRNADVAQPRQQVFDSDARFHPAERRTEAAVRAFAETHVIAHAWPGDARVRVRMGLHTGEPLVGLFNFSGNPVGSYRLGLPFGGTWDEVLNTDAVDFGGSGVGNYGAVEAVNEPWGDRKSVV